MNEASNISDLVGTILYEQDEALAIALEMLSKNPTLLLWHVIGIYKKNGSTRGCVVIAESADKALRNAIDKLNIVFPAPVCSALWQPNEMIALRVNLFSPVK